MSADEFTSKYAKIDDLNITNNLIVGVGDRVTVIEEDYITTGDLNATNSLIVGVGDRVTVIEEDYITTGDLNETNSLIVGVGDRVTVIEEDYIKASTVKAEYMEVANWTSSGYIKAGKINADNITVGTLSAKRLDISGIASGLSSYTIYCQGLEVEAVFTYKNYAWVPKSIDGVTYLVANGVSASAASG